MRATAPLSPDHPRIIPSFQSSPDPLEASPGNRAPTTAKRASCTNR